MSHSLRLYTFIGLALLVAAAALVSVALAAPITLGTETLLGGGPGGSEWEVDNDGGTSNGLPAGGTDDGSPGLNVNDAEFTGGQSDAFDHGLIVFVDDVIFAAPGGAADRTGETLTAGPVTMSGLDVSMEYFALSSEAKLRTLVTFVNPSGSPIAATVSWVTNMGSDDTTVVPGTSSGDTTFTTADRWVVTSDDLTSPSDPVNTHVLFGPGSPAVTPSSVSQTVFDNSDTDGILAEYDITVPAGETRLLLFFNQMSLTNGDALTDAAAQFGANPPPASELLSSLSAAQLAGVLNWDFPPIPTPTPTPTAAPTPTATPAATPTPTPTLAALPDTGGTPSQGGSSTVPGLLAIAGALAVISAGGLWLAHQRRRVR